MNFPITFQLLSGGSVTLATTVECPNPCGNQRGPCRVTPNMYMWRMSSAASICATYPNAILQLAGGDGTISICNNINDGMTSTNNASSYSFTLVNNGKAISNVVQFDNPKICGQPNPSDCIDTCKEIYYQCIAEANYGPAPACESAMQNCMKGC